MTQVWPSPGPGMFVVLTGAARGGGILISHLLGTNRLNKLKLQFTIYLLPCFYLNICLWMVDCESGDIHYLDIRPVNKRALWSLAESSGVLWSISCQSELQGRQRRNVRDGSLALDWLTFLINITLGFLYTNYIQRYTTILTNARMHFKHSHPRAF